MGDPAGAATLPLVLSGVCGMAMAATVAAGASGVAAGAALAAAGAVLAGFRWRAAATAAVLLAVVAIGISDPPTVSAAVAGLTAVGYLVLRHAGTMTLPTVIAALGFTVAGSAATAFPWSLPWLPLLAPFVVLGVGVVVAQPFLAAGR
ncbi:hypothetical protein [Mycolicibacter senuensis]|uniref:Integral membrane protein n=1 Tax=Mycolicibacter senuensis TaxID=386913 RepID=A0A7I9XJ65_9MYCO|nr:hypothetical protein [Mycolicibacter senuensis]ORW67392.1 hypothetical protein AWC24_10630 [Mycolicibacter senuensis]GFG69580.1 hypothetical protein MSEN_13000 [Mycolicibacter senuensis]